MDRSTFGFEDPESPLVSEMVICSIAAISAIEDPFADFREDLRPKVPPPDIQDDMSGPMNELFRLPTLATRSVSSSVETRLSTRQDLSLLTNTSRLSGEMIKTWAWSWKQFELVALRSTLLPIGFVSLAFMLLKSPNLVRKNTKDMGRFCLCEALKNLARDKKSASFSSVSSEMWTDPPLTSATSRTMNRSWAGLQIRRMSLNNFRLRLISWLFLNRLLDSTTWVALHSQRRVRAAVMRFSLISRGIISLRSIARRTLCCWA